MIFSLGSRKYESVLGHEDKIGGRTRLTIPGREAIRITQLLNCSKQGMLRVKVNDRKVLGFFWRPLEGMLNDLVLWLEPDNWNESQTDTTL